MLLVRDLGSTNGTRVNGQRVRRSNLMPDDLIAFANFRYRLKLGDSQAELDPVGDAGPSPRDAVDDGPDTPPPVGTPARKPDEPTIKRNTLPDVYDK